MKRPIVFCVYVGVPVFMGTTTLAVPGIVLPPDQPLRQSARLPAQGLAKCKVM